jgi:thiol-disulfide isomerase/thioredoxin
MVDRICKDGVCSLSENEIARAKELNSQEENLDSEVISVFLFGKKECPLCKETKEMLSDMQGALSFESHYFDVETVDGLSKAAYYNAFDLPVTMIFKNGQEVKRWDSEVPDLLLFKEKITS